MTRLDSTYYCMQFPSDHIVLHSIHHNPEDNGDVLVTSFTEGTTAAIALSRTDAVNMAWDILTHFSEAERPGIKKGDYVSCRRGVYSDVVGRVEEVRDSAGHKSLLVIGLGASVWLSADNCDRISENDFRSTITERISEITK